jgi:hypothetical protein
MLLNLINPIPMVIIEIINLNEKEVYDYGMTPSQCNFLELLCKKNGYASAFNRYVLMDGYEKSCYHLTKSMARMWIDALVEKKEFKLVTPNTPNKIKVPILTPIDNPYFQWTGEVFIGVDLAEMESKMIDPDVVEVSDIMKQVIAMRKSNITFNE